MTVKQAKKHCIYIILIVIVLVGVFFLPREETPNLLENNGKGAFDLSAHWSQGNIVALIRHVERCDQSENQCLEGKTGITMVGKKMALKLGEDFKTLLDLDNATIYNSPVKRTTQTAKLIFGNLSIDKKWLGAGDCRENLLKNILKYKEDGKNLILITHSTCIATLHEAEGDRLIKMGIRNKKTYGATFFLAINRHGKHVFYLGYLHPEDWAQLLMKPTPATHEQPIKNVLWKALTWLD